MEQGLGMGIQCNKESKWDLIIIISNLPELLEIKRVKGTIMNFCIQASTPSYCKTINLNDKCLSEAIESVFPLYTENAIMMWNHISIPLSYKYDISYMINDIIKLIGNLQDEISGKIVIHWLPDTFRCDWKVEWAEGMLCICSDWECTVGHLEKILNYQNSITMSVTDFINEWKQLLDIVITGLKYVGYDKIEIEGMNELFKQFDRISGIGILYTNGY